MKTRTPQKRSQRKPETATPVAADLPDTLENHGLIYTHVDRMSEDHAHLFWIVRRYYGFIEAACPAGHGLRLIFDRIIGDAAVFDADFYGPPAETLLALKNLLAELPEEEQRRIFNGWKLEADLSSPAAMREWATAGDVHSCLQICARGRNDARAYRVETVSESTNGVEIGILEGTSRQDAIETLESALDYVKRFYHVAIQDHEKANKLAETANASDDAIMARGRELTGFPG